MKITDIRVTHVNVPLDAPFWWTAGLYGGASKSIVEVETDEGVVGLGEAPWWHFGEVIKAEIAPALIGADPLDIADCESRCVPPWQITANTGENAASVAFGSVELALWDIRGKVFGMPLYKLLGGAVRKDIPFSEYFSFRPDHEGAGGEMTPEAIVDYCLEMREAHGSTIFEGKLIMGDPQLEIRTVRLLREALGEAAQIRLDSNMQWSLTSARWVLREIEPYNIRNYEDPVATFEEMAALRQHSRIPFSTHVPDLRRAVALGAPDYFVCNFAALGGDVEDAEVHRRLRSDGQGFLVLFQRSRHHDGGLSARHRRDAVDHRGLAIAVPLAGRRRRQGRTVPADEQRRARAGRPGLGVELDPKAMAKWAKHFADNGPRCISATPTSPAAIAGCR